MAPRKYLTNISAIAALASIAPPAISQQTGTVRPDAAGALKIRPMQYCNWNGGFDTPFGRLNLAQQGKTVTGTYAKIGFIAGMLDDKCVLKGHFTNSRVQKHGAFEFTPSKGGFAGEWNWFDSPDRKRWTGKRVNSKAGGGALPNKPKCNWTGTFGGSEGSFVLTQTGTNVAGKQSQTVAIINQGGSYTEYKGKVGNNCILKGSYTRKSRGTFQNKSSYSKGTMRIRLYGDVFAGVQNHENKGDQPWTGARMSGWGVPTPVGGD